MDSNLISLDEVKAHLRVTSADEDELITVYLKAAEDHITQYLDGEIPGIGDSPAAVPYSIKAAALLLIADYYANREALIVGTISSANPALRSLLYPYRALGV